MPLNGVEMKKQVLVLFVAVASLVTVYATSSYAIPSTYGNASHSTKKWQELATYDENNKRLHRRGIYWSTDGGQSWGRDSLAVGQTVQFQINVHKRTVGTHYADFMKLWIDWDQDGSFDGSDVAAFEMMELSTYEAQNLGPNKPNHPNYTFYSGEHTITDDSIGNVWLRARVVCSESLAETSLGSNDWSQQWLYNINDYYNAFAPTGHYYPGEAEHWKLTVAPVPEPATLFLFGLGLSGLMAIKNRKKQR